MHEKEIMQGGQAEGSVEGADKTRPNYTTV